MEVQIIPALAFLFLTIAGSVAHNHDTEMYWHSVLPNAVMPKPLKDLLQNDKVDFHAGLLSHNDAFERGAYGIQYNRGLHLISWDRLVKLNETIYFFEKDLRYGRKMNLRFLSDNGATFLPRQVADSIPFKSNKIPQILKHFAIKPETKEAKEIKKTISICEIPGIKGEHKYCASSLESMIDFSVSELGRSAKVLATEVKGKGQRQWYTVVGVNKAGEKSIVCHKLNYAYAVYYCHNIQATRTYSISLVGADGSKVKALAVCHADTSAWNPQFPAFKILKVEPGTVPICHFLAKDTLVWVSN